jgi:hypothetical protein
VDIRCITLLRPGWDMKFPFLSLVSILHDTPVRDKQLSIHGHSPEHTSTRAAHCNSKAHLLGLASKIHWRQP